MSRSRRKTPIFGHTTSRSERQDKQIWHQRWRAHERTALNSASPETLEAHMPVARNQVSDPWKMDKDGHSWSSIDQRIALAQWRASWKARSDQERAAIETRVLRKLMSK